MKIVSIVFLCFQVHIILAQTIQTTIHFNNEELRFPTNVESAFKKHKLSYVPPGFYYKTDSTNYELILALKFVPGDYINENQPKEVLFPRAVQGYIFRFKDQPELFDLLKVKLEKAYHSKFILTKGLKHMPDILPEEHKKALEPYRPFEQLLMRVNDCLTIGIRRSKSENLGATISVHFMHNLPLGEIGIQMGSY